MGSAAEKELAFSYATGMNVKTRKLILWIALAWAIALLFIPIRNDYVTGYYDGNTPETKVMYEANDVYTSSILVKFHGHPGGIGGLMFFAFMPVLIIWQSFNMKQPFRLAQRSFLQLQALVLFLGAPYCYYMSTFESEYFYDTKHVTEMAIGGWVLFAQNILTAFFLFTAIAIPNGWSGKFFEKR
jgi:hypothetical protein